MISDGVYNLLATDATIASSVSDRIYPVLPPQGASLPLITYAQTSGEYPRELNDDGTCAGPDTVRFQIDVWGLSYSTVKTISARVVALFRGRQRGAMGTGGPTANYARVEDEQDVEELPGDGEPILFHTRVDVLVNYNPA